MKHCPFENVVDVHVSLLMIKLMVLSLFVLLLMGAVEAEHLLLVQ